ncbi:hypothetical protein ACSA002_1340 [Salmonella phage vB_SalM_SA002]|nr:hypothetical protein ACSA002_1340 [Salmonella phage vB_SalM_SA002]
MASNIVPPLLLAGLWTLKEPFKVTPNTKYTVEAVRTFDEMLRLNVDIVERVYAPVGLDKSAYESDVLALAKIVSLTAPGQTTVYVPSTYIERMPDDTAVSYDFVVLSIPLGAVPTTLIDQMQQTMDEVKSTISDLIGITPEVNVSIAPSAGTVTVEQHRINEENRLNTIKRRTTEHAENLLLTAENERLRLIIQDYEKRLTGQS